MSESDGIERVASEGSRTLVALSERVAVVETKVGALKEDTGVIRSTMHSINNEMQRFVSVEQQCAAALNQLVALTKDLPTIAEHARDFVAMRSGLTSVIEEHHQRRGAWAAAATTGSVVLGSITVGGAIVGMVLWLMGHVH